MKYQVFDNNKPAILNQKCWSNCVFNSYKEAFDYAQQRLGPCFGEINIPVDTKIDYNGYRN